MEFATKLEVRRAAASPLHIYFEHSQNALDEHSTKFRIVIFIINSIKYVIFQHFNETIDFIDEMHPIIRYELLF